MPNQVYATDTNIVTLNFGSGTIENGLVKYTDVGTIELVEKNGNTYTQVNLQNDMQIDLDEKDYYFQITEITPTNNSGVTGVTGAPKLRLVINGWYYSLSSTSPSLFQLDTAKFKGTLKVRLDKSGTVINTKVETDFTNLTSQGTVDLSNGREYVIDFSKDDNLSKGLQCFADLNKTLYYKLKGTELRETNNPDEAIIKIVGNASENKAILTAVNVNGKTQDVVDDVIPKYTGSKLEYNGTLDNIITETRTDYYTICTYHYTFLYVNNQVETLGDIDIESATLDYKIGDAPKATAIKLDPYEYGYEIEYECWEEVEKNAQGELQAVKYWYSDQEKNNALASDKKIKTFEEGKTYRYSLSLKTKEGYVFSNQKEVMVNASRINQNQVTYSPSRLVVHSIKTMTLKQVQWIEIKEVEINNVTTQFYTGDKPQFTGQIDENAPYDYQCERWETKGSGITSGDLWNRADKWGTLITQFEKGKTYTYGLYLRPKDGYYFTKDTRLKINGKYYDYQYSSEDNDLENPDFISTFWVNTSLTMTPKNKQVTVSSTNTKKTQTKNVVNTADQTNIIGIVSLFVFSLLGVCIALRKKRTY